MDEDIKVRLIGDATSLEKASKQSTQALDNISKASNNTAQQLSKTSAQITQSASTMARTAGMAGGAVVKSTRDFTGLSRVIQDLPYGFNAISNNLTQLLPAAGAAGLAFSGIVTALTLAQIGFGAWTRGLGSSKQALEDQVKAANEAKQALQTYVESLSDINKVRVVGLQDAQKELVNLRTLYDATQNVNIPLAQRKKIVDELQEQYPKYFKNISDEIILAGGAKKAYDQLSTAIIASARARAGQDELVDVQKQLIALDQQYAASVIATAKKQQELSREQAKAAAVRSKYTAEDAKNSMGFNFNSAIIGQKQEELNSKLKSQNDLLKKRNDLQERAKQLSNVINRAVEVNPEAILNPTGNEPKVKAPKEVKSEFLFDFLPFDPSGKLKPEQKAQVETAIEKFQKEFRGILKGVDFDVKAKTQDEKIKLALDFDAKLKAGKVEIDVKSITDAINKTLKPEDLLPNGLDFSGTLKSLEESQKRAIEHFINGAKDESERLAQQNVFNLPLNFNLSTDLPAQIDLFKTKLKQLGLEIPKAIKGVGLQGQPVELTLDDLIDTSKIANNDALEALKKAFSLITGEAVSQADQLNKAINDAIANISIEGLSSIGQTIADTLTGGDIGGVFKSFEQTLGSAIEALGKQMIALFVTADLLKKALKSVFTNPVVGIAAGVALVAVGATIKKLAGGGIKGFQRGENMGFVPGSGSVDSVPIMATPGELIVSKKNARLVMDFLRTRGETPAMPRILNGMMGFAGGGLVTANVADRNAGFTGNQLVDVHITGISKTRGQDIVHSWTQTVKSQRRAT